VYVYVEVGSAETEKARKLRRKIVVFIFIELGLNSERNVTRTESKYDKFGSRTNSIYT